MGYIAVREIGMVLAIITRPLAGWEGGVDILHRANNRLERKC